MVDRWIPPTLILSLALLAPAPALAEDADGRMATETSLRSSPEATDLSGLLTAGTPVRVLERRNEWVRVSIEGWVRATAVEADSAVEVQTPPIIAAVPSPAGSPPAPGFPVEGMIQVDIKPGAFKKKVSAAGASIWLVPAAVDLHERDAETESDERLAQLDAEVQRLEREADEAMRMDSFTEATTLRDELMKQRSAVLSERRDLLTVRHGRHERIAEEAALASSLADSKGWFSLSDISPGIYALYARLTQEKLDLEWIETVTVDRAAVRIDLDETRARGLAPGDKSKKNKKQK